MYTSTSNLVLQIKIAGHTHEIRHKFGFQKNVKFEICYNVKMIQEKREVKGSLTFLGHDKQHFVVDY